MGFCKDKITRAHRSMLVNGTKGCDRQMSDRQPPPLEH